MQPNCAVELCRDNWSVVNLNLSGCRRITDVNRPNPVPQLHSIRPCPRRYSYITLLPSASPVASPFHPRDTHVTLFITHCTDVTHITKIDSAVLQCSFRTLHSADSPFLGVRRAPRT